MSHNQSTRMLLLKLNYCFYREFLMNMTSTVPKKHFATCSAIYIVSKIIIRTKDNLLILRETINNLFSITTCYNTISKCLNSCCSIYIAYNLISRMLILEFLQVFSLTTISQRTTSIKVRTKNSFLRT